MAKAMHVAAEITRSGARLSWMCEDSYSISAGERAVGILTWQQFPMKAWKWTAVLGTVQEPNVFRGPVIYHIPHRVSHFRTGPRLLIWRRRFWDRRGQAFLFLLCALVASDFQLQ